MNERGFKLFDDQDAAVKIGTPFQVNYFIKPDQERFLYFKTSDEAFVFVQNHPEVERPEIKDLSRCGIVLYPKDQ